MESMSVAVGGATAEACVMARARRQRSKAARELRRVVRKRLLTVEDAAELVDASRLSLIRWMNDQGKPSHAMAVRLEDEFGIGHRLWLAT